MLGDLKIVSVMLDELKIVSFMLDDLKIVSFISDGQKIAFNWTCNRLENLFVPGLDCGAI